MHVSIISPEGSLYDGEAWSVSLPSKKSPFTALENHAPVVCSLSGGKVEVCPEKDAEKVVFEISGGFAEIHNNKSVICIELSQA